MTEFIATKHGGGGPVDLVSWWSMDETSGTRYDKLGNNDLDDINTVGYDTGKHSNAASFSAANDEYLEAVDPDRLIGAESDWAFGAWVDPTGPLGYQIVCSSTDNYGGNSTENDFIVWIDDDGWWTVTIVGTGAGSSFQDIFFAEASGDLQFILVSHDVANKAVTMWIDGVDQGTWNHTNTPQAVGDRFAFGKYSWIELTALVDEAFFFRRQMTDADAATLWNDGDGHTYESYLAAL